jgi:tRNA(fMet)-specific endonuclease VapC
VNTLMLDTSVCIDLIRGEAPALAQAIPRHRGGRIVVSAITLGELLFGEAKRGGARRRQPGIRDLLAPFAVLPFGDDASVRYGPLRAALEAAGRPIGPLDTLIAAHALAVDATLITANLREFKRVPGLRSSATLSSVP